MEYFVILFVMYYDEQNDDDGGDTAYITFANLTRDTTCTMRSDGTSCYALINLDDITNIINNAFVSYFYSSSMYRHNYI